MNDMNVMEAYAIGYYDGRAKGYELNPYDQEMPERYWYNLGYEAGVSEYCRELDE